MTDAFVDGRSVADDRLASLPTAPRIDRPNAPHHNRSIRKLTLVLLPAWLFAQSGIHDDDARHLLYSARYADAAIAYRELLTAHPDWGDGYDALTRALLGAKRTPEAYRVAEEAMQNAPDSAGAQAAVGRIRFRQGDLAAADGACHKAARLDTHSAVALASNIRYYRTLFCAGDAHVRWKPTARLSPARGVPDFLGNLGAGRAYRPI
ncbi:MAG: hypothetical protein WCB12_18425 [Bryobacteraceae bacterium]